MSKYRRLISYIYAYEGGVKGKNVGYAKIEVRNGQCKLSVNVKKVYVGSNEIGVYLLADQKEMILGNIFIRNGSGEFRTVFNAEDIEGSGVSMEQCYGLTIHDVESAWQAYTTIWEDAVSHAAEIELADITAENRIRQKEQLGRQSKTTAASAEPVVRAAEADRREPERDRETQLEQADLAAEESLQQYIQDNPPAVPPRPVETGGIPPSRSAPWPAGRGRSRSAPRPGTPMQWSAGPEAQAPAAAESHTPPGAAVQPSTGAGAQNLQIPTDATAQSSAGTAALSPAPAGPAAGQSPEAPAATSDPAAAPEHAATPEQAADPQDSQNPQNPTPVRGTGRPKIVDLTGGNLPVPGDPSQLAELERQEMEAVNSDITWNSFQSHYPKLRAFDYENGCEIISIRPQDLGLLPREIWVYGNNSFLLHGYYNYRYLILARLNNPGGEPRYLLGVPGHYYSNEKYMASMFGFPNFVLSKQQPQQDGRFGYWYTDIRL